jgi:hypothetical protein
VSEFKLCESAGLKINSVSYAGSTPLPIIEAAEVESLLANAPVVYGRKNAADIWVVGERKDHGDTHQLRLLLIEPIKRESEEITLLRKAESILSKLAVQTSEPSVADQVRAFLNRLDEGGV